MHIRPATTADLDRLLDIDGTIESSEYLHLERSGEGLASGWKLDLRRLRQKFIEANALDDDCRFILKQVVTGADEGVALVAEHEGQLVALALAQPRLAQRTMHLIDLRVDYDFRREGLGTALVFQVIQNARDRELRAVSVETRSNNLAANRLMQKLAFDLGGVDTHRHSNFDLVKEAATLFWYAALE